MMHGPEKSDPGIVAMSRRTKRSNPLRSRWSEGRGPRGMRTSKARAGTQSRISVSQALERIRKVQNRFAVTHPRWEPYAGKPHVRFCAGGAQQ